jgi:hypothetical protein
MSQFLFQPATVVVGSVPEYIAWKVWTPDQSLTLPTKHQILRLTAGDGYSITEFRWEENPVRNAKQWLFTEEDGTTIQVRQALPGDAVSTGLAPYPLPEKLLRERTRNPSMDGQQEELMAAVNPDDNYVLTLILVSPAGVYARYSANWFEIASANSLGNCYLTGVHPEAVEMYDVYDSKGSQVSVKELPTIRDWVPQTDVATVQISEETALTPNEAPGNPEGIAEESRPAPTVAPVTSAGVLVLPTKADQDDIIAQALALGKDNEEVRWAIQRRLSQLDWQGDIPWN